MVSVPCSHRQFSVRLDRATLGMSGSKWHALRTHVIILHFQSGFRSGMCSHTHTKRRLGYLCEI